VIALAHKSYALAMKGHDARAAENFSRAAEEAEHTLPSPDCLIACALRQEQLDALLRHATTPAEIPADADDALREACLRLLPSVMAVLERRKAAGTLLPGSCRPVEETYHMAVKRHRYKLQGFTQAGVADCVADFAPYMGVETYFRVAASAAFMICKYQTMKRAFGISDEQANAACLFIANALDLMMRPRDLEAWLPGEPELVRLLRGFIPEMSVMDEPETIKLCAAWRRVLRSGLLRERGIDDGIAQGEQQHMRVRAAANAEIAAGRLQQCTLAGCAAHESHPSHFKRCGACRAVCYCCREHQVEDWPSHKAACKAARKAAADAGTSSEAAAADEA
jgi:hypothetical protein